MSSSPRLKPAHGAPSSLSPLALQHGALAAVEACHQGIQESRGGDGTHLAERRVYGGVRPLSSGAVAAQARNSLGDDNN